MKQILVTFFLIVYVLQIHLQEVKALGVGECHSPVNIKNPLVKWSYPSGEVRWSTLEPQKGKYNFKNMDDFLKKVKAAGKKAFLQVLVNDPASAESFPTVPQWAIDEGMHVVNKGIPIQWDPLYLEYHEKILKAVADRYENSEYSDVIEAVLIQGGGNYGEMTVGRKYCYGEPNADVMDPNNIYVREMARVFLGSEDKASELTKIEGGKIVFDTYFIKTVQNIIDIYARSFSKYPILIQGGHGLSCQGRVLKEVLEYGVSKYSNRFWMRNNGLGSFTGLGEGPDSDSYMGKYKDKTIIGYELGHPSYWCASEGGKYPKGISVSTGACKWDTREEAIKHNTFTLQYALNTGASHICFQHPIFENREKYPIDLEALQISLEKNVNQEITKITPVLTVTSAPPLISNTDVDRDGKTTYKDYFYFVMALYGASLPAGIHADVDNNGLIDGNDKTVIIKILRN